MIIDEQMVKTMKMSKWIKELIELRENQDKYERALAMAMHDTRESIHQANEIPIKLLNIDGRWCDDHCKHKEEGEISCENCGVRYYKRKVGLPIFELENNESMRTGIESSCGDASERDKMEKALQIAVREMAALAKKVTGSVTPLEELVADGVIRYKKKAGIEVPR